MADKLLILGSRALFAAPELHTMQHEIREAGFDIVVCGSRRDADGVLTSAMSVNASDWAQAAGPDHSDMIRNLIARSEIEVENNIVMISAHPADVAVADLMKIPHFHPFQLQAGLRESGGVEDFLNTLLKEGL